MTNLSAEILQAIRKELRESEFATWKANLSEIEKSLKFISAQYNDAIKSIAAMKEDMNSLKKENNTLRGTIKDLQGTIRSVEHDLGKQEQWARQQNVEILGIPENNTECLPNVIIKIANKAGLKLETSDIDFAHRVQPKKQLKGIPRAIVTRFKLRRSNDEFMSAVRKCKNITTEDIGFTGQARKIFVNEHLTQRNKKLLSLCKAKAKEFAYQYVWTKNCRIYIRKNDTSPHQLILSELDLVKII